MSPSVLTYTIGEPVDTVPPVVKTNKPRDNWSFCWQAAEEAQGRWVPIAMPSTLSARNLAAIAKKRKQLDAESRGAICYFRTVPK